MFERLTSLLGGSGRPHATLTNALKPIAAVDPDLAARCAAYVHDGSAPEVVLQVGTDPRVAQAMPQAGRLEKWYQAPVPAIQPLLAKLGLTGRDADAQVRRLRFDFYATNARPDQWVRMGRLLVALGGEPNRMTAGAEPWFVALVNDVAACVPDRTKQGRAAKQLPAWTPDRLADILRAGEVAEESIPEAVFCVLLQRDADWWGSAFLPNRFPGVDEFLATVGRALPAGVAARLTAEARRDLLTRVSASPALADALAHVVASLVVDTAKTVRVDAVKALDALGAARRLEVLRAVVAAAPASRAAELVEYLSRTDEGAAVLADAVAAGAKVGALVAQAEGRRAALADSASGDAPALVAPPFTPLAEARLGEEAVTALREAVERTQRIYDEAAAHHGQSVPRGMPVDSGELRRVVAVANGDVPGPAKLAGRVGALGAASQVPAFTLVHLLRIGDDGRRNLPLLLSHRAAEVTDLRAVEDACRRAGWEYPAIAELAGDSWYFSADPGAAWPWFAEHLDVLQQWLAGDTATALAALRVLDAFPVLPPDVLPSLSALSLGTSRTVRPVAQQVLSKHGLARRLAEQGLADGKAEVRAASAQWLASIGDPDAVGAVRTALAKEKRDVARAAFLAAIPRLGGDVSAELSPEKLGAEASKGLKGGVPTALAWLDVDALPACTWADGSPVDPQVVRWWVVLADKLKNPDGSGLLDLYLGLLAPDSVAALGRFALASWVAQDTRHPAEEESRASAAQDAPGAYAWAQSWLRRARASAHQEMLAEAEAMASVTLEEHERRLYAAHQATYIGSAINHKGLLALTTRLPGIELAQHVQAYIRDHGARRAQVEALVTMLYGNGDLPAVQLLLGIARRFKQASVQATAGVLVEKLADRRGWTPDELADRTVPTAGFGDDRLLHLDYGPRSFVGRATPAGTIVLSTPDGTPVKSLPDPRATDDAEVVKETKKQLTAARKELKAVLTQQTARLYEAMCLQRTWPAADWRDYLVAHPLVGQLVTRLVWLENPGEGQRAFRPAEDGTLLDLDDSPIDLAPDAVVAVAHGVLVDDADAAAWVAHLADYEVQPLFAQFAHGMPSFTPDAVTCDDLQGHMTDTFSFRGMATKRGYQRAAAEDGGWFYEYTKPFGALTAAIEFTGNYLPEGNISCATMGLSFRGRRDAVRLAEVPPILLAECYADYAALAALGPFDPDWRRKASL